MNKNSSQNSFVNMHDSRQPFQKRRKSSHEFLQKLISVEQNFSVFRYRDNNPVCTENNTASSTFFPQNKSIFRVSNHSSSQNSQLLTSLYMSPSNSNRKQIDQSNFSKKRIPNKHNYSNQISIEKGEINNENGDKNSKQILFNEIQLNKFKSKSYYPSTTFQKQSYTQSREDIQNIKQNMQNLPNNIYFEQKSLIKNKNSNELLFFNSNKDQQNVPYHYMSKQLYQNQSAKASKRNLLDGKEFGETSQNDLLINKLNQEENQLFQQQNNQTQKMHLTYGFHNGGSHIIKDSDLLNENEDFNNIKVSSEKINQNIYQQQNYNLNNTKNTSNIKKESQQCFNQLMQTLRYGKIQQHQQKIFREMKQKDPERNNIQTFHNKQNSNGYEFNSQLAINKRNISSNSSPQQAKKQLFTSTGVLNKCKQDIHNLKTEQIDEKNGNLIEETFIDSRKIKQSNRFGNSKQKSFSLLQDNLSKTLNSIGFLEKKESCRSPKQYLQQMHQISKEINEYNPEAYNPFNTEYHKEKYLFSKKIINKDDSIIESLNENVNQQSVNDENSFSTPQKIEQIIHNQQNKNLTQSTQQDEKLFQLFSTQTTQQQNTQESQKNEPQISLSQAFQQDKQNDTQQQEQQRIKAKKQISVQIPTDYQNQQSKQTKSQLSFHEFSSQNLKQKTQDYQQMNTQQSQSDKNLISLQQKQGMTNKEKEQKVANIICKYISQNRQFLSQQYHQLKTQLSKKNILNLESYSFLQKFIPNFNTVERVLSYSDSNLQKNQLLLEKVLLERIIKQDDKCLNQDNQINKKDFFVQQPVIKNILNSNQKSIN